MENWKINWPFNKWISVENAAWYIAISYLAFHMYTFPFVMYPSLSDSGPTWLGLDVSWQMTLNYAWMHNLNWGNDIVFSYGPLGFLSTRVGWGISKWLFILFDLFMILNFFFVFRDFVFRSGEKFLAVLVLIYIILLINPYYGSDVSWVFMFFTFYWMYKAYKEPKLVYYILILFLIGLSFYIKLNTALVIIVFFAGYLGNLVVFKEMSYKNALFLIGGLSAWIVLLAFCFNVSLLPYIKGSIEIIKGYNDIMYLQEDHETVEISLDRVFWIIMILYIIFALLLVKHKRYKEVYFTMMCAGFVFLLRKQSMVRNDVQHLYEFFSYAPLVLLTGNLFSGQGKVKKYFLQGIFAIILLFLLIKTGSVPVETALDMRFGKSKEYLQHIKEYNQDVYQSFKDKRLIPAEALYKIGDKTIDVFPWDIEYLLQNKLNYAPRPVFQTYTAYTAYLEQKNYEYYEKKGPEYVLYDYDAIDNRYPFNDEYLVNLFIAHNYTVSDTFTSNERWRILLKRNKEIHPLNFHELKNESINIDQEISIDNAKCVKLDLQYNLLGKFRTFSYKPPPINILFMKTDGQWISFKTSAELLRGGLAVDKLILSTKDFANYITDSKSLSPIVKLKLELDKKYFSSKMKLTQYDLIE